MALGANFVSYADALNRAHSEAKLSGIDTELLQKPTPENDRLAIVKATVRTEKGNFSGLGDATPYEDPSYDPETKKMGKKPVASATIRMAETRAKARGLRDAINLGTPVEGDIADQEIELLTQEQLGDIAELAEKIDTLGSLEEFERKVKVDPFTLDRKEADTWIMKLHYRLRQQDRVEEEVPA